MPTARASFLLGCAVPTDLRPQWFALRLGALDRGERSKLGFAAPPPATPAAALLPGCVGPRTVVPVRPIVEALRARQGSHRREPSPRTAPRGCGVLLPRACRAGGMDQNFPGYVVSGSSGALRTCLAAPRPSCAVRGNGGRQALYRG